MYYPIQVPYLLNKEFLDKITYKEEVITSLQDYAICFWEMQSCSNERDSIKDVIVIDGCIDLVVSFEDKQIGYVGMSKTNFNYNIDLPARFMGVRLKPGIFYLLTGISATEAMDNFLSLADVDQRFDVDLFFSLSFEEQKIFLIDYLFTLSFGKELDQFSCLFDELCEVKMQSTRELYDKLHLSPRQTQRLFMKHYGVTPQAVLSIIRFQSCIKALMSKQAVPSDILAITTYYDQSHFIKDFKKHIGLTPFEFLRACQS